MTVGIVPLASYATTGTAEVAESMQPFLAGHDAMLLENHGVVSYGKTLVEAFMKMETVEHFAQIALVTHCLGRQQPLGQQDLEKLLLVRSKYEGAHSVAAMPLAAPSRFPAGQNHGKAKGPARARGAEGEDFGLKELASGGR